MWHRIALQHFRVLIGGLGTACLLAAASADAAIYIKFDGIDGEVIEKDHDKWVAAQTVDWGLGLDASQARPVLKFDDVEWSQTLDVAFPDLFLATANRDRIDSVKIDFTKPAGEKTVTYFSMKFDSATISRLDLAGTGEGAMVTGAFAYEAVSLSYTKYGPDGKAGINRTARFVLRDGSAAAAAALLSVYQLGMSDPPTPAVPEPGTWALTVVGLGVLAFGARRAQRRR